MIKVSSIIIAINEEKNIRRLLKSQLNCIDEIILLIDNKTTDNTASVAAEFPNIICRHVDWLGYSKTKEYAVSLASNDWILWIDADEALTPQLQNELLLFKNSTPLHAAYSIPRKAFFLGRWILHSGWYPGRVTRLFHRSKAKFSGNDVHEHLLVDGTTGEFYSDIEHYTDPDIVHYFNKFNKYTSLAAEDLTKKGKRFKISDMILRPLVVFIKMYIIKRGFADGIQGFILAVFSSAYVFTKYAKFWELKYKGDKDGSK